MACFLPKQGPCQPRQGWGLGAWALGPAGPVDQEQVGEDEAEQQGSVSHGVPVVFRERARLTVAARLALRAVHTGHLDQSITWSLGPWALGKGVKSGGCTSYVASRHAGLISLRPVLRSNAFNVAAVSIML